MGGEIIGVGLAGGEDEGGALEFGIEGAGALRADLEFAVQAGVVAGVGEPGGADEALHFGVVICFVFGELAELAFGSGLGAATSFGGGELVLEALGEGLGLVLGQQTFGDGRADGGIGEGAVQTFGVAQEGAEGGS